MRTFGSSWTVYTVGIRLVSKTAMEQGGANENVWLIGLLSTVLL